MQQQVAGPAKTGVPTKSAPQVVSQPQTPVSVSGGVNDTQQGFFNIFFGGKGEQGGPQAPQTTNKPNSG